MNADYNSQYSRYLNLIENKIDEVFNALTDIPPLLKEAMQYAVLGGGKRIRPVICLACAEALNVPIKEVINRLEGIRCGMRSTSCPDQISKALKTI